ncbi:hypothetical protein BJ684DRAFT_18928 [Piptocephalis cylindrospora]|uniref:Tail specific protease domain-containing protein n=1 Tax=Piptocephalis cylindrospora TaxID=1907219 RepID=A0A4P9Y6G9_9FUNG|nr:hypothetical protein BJ684DRAFT_18928 [Piptocephalis cylindrospora]|eukprot:RKP14686.1 hypothetical protein BJ684DRAFT_18928 [Piptocephalis cylindrospora]
MYEGRKTRERARLHEEKRERIERHRRAEEREQVEKNPSEAKSSKKPHQTSKVYHEEYAKPLSLPGMDITALFPVAPFAPRDTLTDPCAQLSQAPEPTHALVLACYDHFLHVPAAFNLTVHSILATLPLYVFLDTASSPPPGSQVRAYNLPQVVQSLLGRLSWPSARAALEALSDAFIPLNDGHTTFTPKCFRRIAYRQPIYPIASVNPQTNDTIVHVGALSHKAPASWSSLLGAEIVTIDGEPATSHLWHYAQRNIGFFKDAATRFSRVFASLTYHDAQWYITPGLWADRTRPPREGAVTYGLRRAGSTDTVKNITIPWSITLPKDGFSSAEDYWTRYCAAEANVTETVDIVSEAESAASRKSHLRASSTAGSIESNVVLRGNRVQTEGSDGLGEGGYGDDKVEDLSSSPIPKARPDQPILVSNSTFSQTPLSAGQDRMPRRMNDGKERPGLRTPVILRDTMALYIMSSAPHVGILVISTFTANPLEEQWAWRNNLALIFREFSRRRLTHLLLELSSNGGGNACLANELLGALTPGTSSSRVFPSLSHPFLKDTRISPLLDRLVRTAHTKDLSGSTFSPSYYSAYPSHKPFSSATALLRQRKSRGRTDAGKYTQLFHDSCPFLSDNPIALAASALSLPPQAIGILSDGMCASACGRVIIYTQSVHGIKTAVTTPIHNMPRSPVAFPASQVFDAKSLQAEISLLGLRRGGIIPGRLPFQANFRFTIRESLSMLGDGQEIGKPLEYLWVPSYTTIPLRAGQKMGPHPPDMAIPQALLAESFSALSADQQSICSDSTQSSSITQYSTMEGEEEDPKANSSPRSSTLSLTPSFSSTDITATSSGSSRRTLTMELPVIHSGYRPCKEEIKMDPPIPVSLHHPTSTMGPGGRGGSHKILGPSRESSSFRRSPPPWGGETIMEEKSGVSDEREIQVADRPDRSHRPVKRPSPLAQVTDSQGTTNLAEPASRCQINHSRNTGSIHSQRKERDIHKLQEVMGRMKVGFQRVLHDGKVRINVSGSKHEEGPSEHRMSRAKGVTVM